MAGFWWSSWARIANWVGDSDGWMDTYLILPHFCHNFFPGQICRPQLGSYRTTLACHKRHKRLKELCDFPRISSWHPFAIDRSPGASSREGREASSQSLLPVLEMSVVGTNRGDIHTFGVLHVRTLSRGQSVERLRNYAIPSITQKVAVKLPPWIPLSVSSSVSSGGPQNREILPLSIFLRTFSQTFLCLRICRKASIHQHWSGCMA